MSGDRTTSLDSGLLSSDLAAYQRDETNLKPVFHETSDSGTVKPQMRRSHTMPSKHRPESSERRRSLHETSPVTGAGHPQADLDTDQGIVPDVTKLLFGSRQRRSKGGTAPVYSIHINNLYVYQNPTSPVENPLYQHLPADRHEDSPPSPCPKPGYQYVWPTSRQDDGKQPEQNHDSTESRQRSRPTSLHLPSREDTPIHHENYLYSRVKGKSSENEKSSERPSTFTLSSPTLAEGEEMEIVIKGKGGKSRRYKLQPILEQPNAIEGYILSTATGNKVVVEGFTIHDKDEAFSEAGSSNFPESSSASILTSGSGAAIDTTVGDCKITVDQTFQDDELMGIQSHKSDHMTSSSSNDLSLQAAPPSLHRYHTESVSAINKNEPPFFQKYSAGSMSQSVPNIAISTRIDTCYECRNQKRGGFFTSRQKLPRNCTLEGFHYITDVNEVEFMKEILEKNGKIGNWFITPTSNQPGYHGCLYVKDKREVISYPVALNKKRKCFLDFNMRKSFPCLCRLTEFYKSNHLPSININLGHPLPKSAFPDMNFGADGIGTITEQYAGIRM